MRCLCFALAVAIPAPTFAEPPKVVPPADTSNAKVITAGVATGALAIATVLAYRHHTELAAQSNDATNLSSYRDQIAETQKWRNVMFTCASATVVSAALTGYFWTRTQPTYSPAVMVAPDGAGLAMSGRF
jgi:hypothetical protein